MIGKLMSSHIEEMLRGGAAHIAFDAVLAGFPPEMAGRRVPGIDHSMWMLVDHLRAVNQDLIDWVEADTYTEKEYPSGYWPAGPEPPNRDAWMNSIAAVTGGLRHMTGWITNPRMDITAPLVRSSAHSAFREILLAVAHNGYHIGQMADLRSLLGVPVRDW